MGEAGGKLTPPFPAFLHDKSNSISLDANSSGPSAPGTVPAENGFGIMRATLHRHRDRVVPSKSGELPTVAGKK